MLLPVIHFVFKFQYMVVKFNSVILDLNFFGYLFSKHNLKVREHNILGPYVDGLSTLAVSSFEVLSIYIVIQPFEIGKKIIITLLTLKFMIICIFIIHINVCIFTEN